MATRDGRSAGAIPGSAPPASRSGAGPSDAALVVAARGGEPWAREALFRRYAPMAGGLALRLMGRDDDVDDLVQDAFVAALRGLDRLDDPQAFAKWLASILVRTSCKTLRRRRLARKLGLRGAEPVDVDGLISPSAPPDAVAELRSVYALLDELPTGVRAALVLRRIEGHGLEEIATLTGASLATVKRRVAEGESRLAARRDQQRRPQSGQRSVL